MRIYARRESTNDSVLIKFGLGRQPGIPLDEETHDSLLKRGIFGKLDVCLYYDEAATHPAARYSWDRSAKPTKRSRTVVHNCARYELVWLDDYLPRDLQAAA